MLSVYKPFNSKVMLDSVNPWQGIQYDKETMLYLWYHMNIVTGNNVLVKSCEDGTILWLASYLYCHTKKGFLSMTHTVLIHSITIPFMQEKF